MQIRVKPGSTRTRVGGVYGEALVVSVQTRAVEGKATEAALAALAKAVGVRRRDLQLRVGATSRDKIVEFVDPPLDLESRLARLRDRNSD